MAKTKLEELLEKCTPGKWEVAGDMRGVIRAYQAEPRKPIVRLVDWIQIDGMSREEYEANAQLIALAPALARSHEAMRKILTTLSHYDLNDDNCASLELASKRIRYLVQPLAEAEKVPNG